MNRTVAHVTAAIAIVALAAGCGPSAKQKKLMADYNNLQSQSLSLEAKVDSLGKANSALQAQIDQQMQEAAALKAEQERLKAQQQETVNKYDDVVKKLSGEVESGNLQVRQYKDMLSVDVAEKLFFDSGSASLKKTGQDVLRKVADAIGQYPDKVIRVVGHTDSIPLGKKSMFASNWELSVVRATTVVRFLQDQCKIPPERLVASGRGPYQPVAENSTPEGRQKNRRIEIMLVDKSIMDSMSTPEAATPSQ